MISGVPLLEEVQRALCGVLLGKPQEIKQALCCLLARGHLLIEDVPGVGKTTLAHALARVLGLSYQRIQFTNDLLPADILGVSVYHRREERFQFHPGPIFAQVVLADEINRATPKSQSALLEAMEERQVTVEGETRPLPMPFFVIATQNPIHQSGTYPLPESQLDRFLMRIALGYPDAAAERELFRGQGRNGLLKGLTPRLDEERLQTLQREVAAVHLSEPLLDYVQALVAYSRLPGRYIQGLSPRAGLALLQAGRAWALLENRDFVLPEDIQQVLPAVAGHRLQAAGHPERESGGLVKALIEAVPVR